MDNLPPGYSDWMTDSQIHETECDEQPEGMPCICDHLADERYEAHVQNQIETERGN